LLQERELATIGAIGPSAISNALKGIIIAHDNLARDTEVDKVKVFAHPTIHEMEGEDGDTVDRMLLTCAHAPQ